MSSEDLHVRERRDFMVGWVFVPMSVAALLCSVILTGELLASMAAHAAGNNFTAICDFGRGFSCSTVFQTPYAQTFGFPNTFLGLVGFAVTLTLGVVLATRAKLPEWVWAGMQAGLLFALGFVLYLWWNILFNVGALCIFCMIVWFAVAMMFSALTVRNFVTWGWLPEKFWSYQWYVAAALQAIIFGAVVYMFAPVWFS